ncbi:MAG TPA: class I SAM-dependent methyltransferase [Polyangia bacterium]|jgi:SAM-dependent methyltransferase|nr:class I SAM-dependent methyltransferase [Polyangia bacterium]
MSTEAFGRRPRYVAPPVGEPNLMLQHAVDCYSKGRVYDALDVCEQTMGRFPGVSRNVLMLAYEMYRPMWEADRHTLYQARHFHFGIRPGDKVLDIGSGNNPLSFATHLADLAVDDDHYGRAGSPFKHIAGKPVFNCPVESMPFADNEFDFVYCSHVLEHVADPERACRELMRVGKRGYVETPTLGKDVWLNVGKISNHRWHVALFNETLEFTEYAPRDLDGVETDLLLDMHMHPQTDREKAFAALVLLKSDVLNTMLLWDTRFSVTARRQPR